MKNKHLFLSPELLSRLNFTQPSPGVYYVQSVPSQKPMRAFPEEIIRQLVILSLIHQYHYPEDSIRIEYPVQMGRTKKRADIVILGESESVEVVIEVKQRIGNEAMEQLKSYLMVTGASFGLGVSGVEYICLKKEARNRFVEVADLPFCGKDGIFVIDPLQSSNIPRFSPTAKLRTALQIECFEKVDQSHVKITIQGQCLNFSNVDLGAYKKFQKRFLSAGVVLVDQIKQTSWLSFIREMLAEAPSPPTPSMAQDQMTTKIANLVEALPSERRFLTAGNIFEEVLGGPNKVLDRHTTIRIAKTMRSLGWKPGLKRVDGIPKRGYLRGTREDEYRPTLEI